MERDYPGSTSIGQTKFHLKIKQAMGVNYSKELLYFYYSYSTNHQEDGLNQKISKILIK